MNKVIKIFLITAIVFNVSYFSASAQTGGFWSNLYTKISCSVSSIFSGKEKCNINTNIINTNTKKAKSEDTSLVKENNSIQSETKNLNTNTSQIVYLQGPAGPAGQKGDKGEKGDVVYVNNPNQNTNWSSLYVPELKYQYVPVASSDATNRVTPNAAITVQNTGSLFSTGLSGSGSSSDANHANIFGVNAGYDATYASESNFLGYQSGYQAINAYNSNFFGSNAGNGATNANSSNFFGQMSGKDATDAYNSNFLGYQSGYGATNSFHSNFFGSYAGQGATNAANSIFIGRSAGQNDTVDNTINGLSSILIGSYTNTGGYSNSILLGNGTSGSPISNTKANQFMLAPSITELNLRGVNYTLPSTIGATGTVLTNDGSGVLSWGVGGGGATDAFVQDGNSFSALATLGTNDNNDLAFETNGTEKMRLTTDGRLGINTTNPTSLLHISVPETNTTFSGAGLNDAVFSGTYSGPGDFVTITITSTDPSGDTYSYSSCCGGGNNTISAGVTQSLIWGMSVTFASATGHQVGDSWTYYSSSRASLNTPAIQVKGSSGNYFIVNAIANNSNFIGEEAGSQATNAEFSNFFGWRSGYQATYASDSNFLGQNAGYGATSASASNFLGYYAGYQATSARQSNFLGQVAGYQATSANYSNFLGNYAGYQAANASNSNFLGQNAGQGATSADNSNFFGQSAGFNATDANYSNFLGSYAGQDATNANFSNFLGTAAGYGATYADHSNFFGSNAGNGATDAYYSNFFGPSAGFNATNANSSNFLGGNAGSNATNAYSSNFLGREAGSGATDAYHSNFLGQNAGYQATYANYSNFLGNYAGYGATDAYHSNFLGQNAGRGATSASYSNLFGYQAGKTFTNNTIGANNIIIGTNISLPNGTANAMNIGGVLFGSGFNSDTSSDPNITAVTSGKIGIAKINPQYTLDVGNSSTIGIIAQFTNSTGYCTINPTNTSLSCTSDINLKKNIVNIKDGSEFVLGNINASDSVSILDKISGLDPVYYNWKSEQDTDAKHAGFIAQQVEQVFPDLVTTDGNTNIKSVNYTGFTPYIVNAIKEIKNTISGTITAMKGYFEEIFTKKIHTDMLCVKKSDGTEFCANGDQLESALNNINGGSTTNTSISSGDDNLENLTVSASSSPSIEEEILDSSTTVDTLIDTSDTQNNN
ncbi:MAG: tail fiber domain-containing protein [Candidatus Paceibacterota bacterium]